MDNITIANDNELKMAAMSLFLALALTIEGKTTQRPFLTTSVIDKIIPRLRLDYQTSLDLDCG